MPEEKMLDRVRKLLDRANHPGTGAEEADACIRKADALMLRHAIDQAMLDARAKDDSRTPITRTFRAFEGWAWSLKFQTILHEMARTGRVRIALNSRDVVVVGMQDDVDYFELVWTGIYLGFVSKIDPRWDDNLSFDHNVYRFKTAGFKWVQIRDRARAANHHVPWPDGGALIRAYKRHAKAIGDTAPVSTQRHDMYRESFAEGFTTMVCRRLESMRADNERMATANGSGAELALVGVAERVDEAFYGLYPDQHPDARREKALELRKKHEEEWAKQQAERQAMLDAMTAKQRQAFLDKEERQRRRDAKASERYWAEQDRKNRDDSQGRSAGRRAGESVDLGGRDNVGGAARPFGEI